MPAGFDAQLLLSLQRTAGNRATALLSAGTAAGAVAPASPVVTADVTPTQADQVSAPLGGAAAALQAPAPSLQRDDEPGLIDRIRNRVRDVAAGLRAGWSAVAQQAGQALDGLRTRGTAAVATITGTGSRVAELARSGWQGARGALTAAGALAGRAVAAAGTAVPAAFDRVRQAMVALDGGGLAAGWSQVTTTAGGVLDRAVAVGQVVGGAVGGAWAALSAHATAALAGARRTSSMAVSGLGALGRGALQGAAATWQSLRGRAAALTEAVSGTLAGRLLRPLISRAQALWGSVQSSWAGARKAAAGVASDVVQAGRAAWTRVSGVAARVVDGVRGAARRAGDAVMGRVRRLTGSLRSAVQRLRRFPVGRLAAKLRTYARFTTVVTTAVADPAAVMAPVAAPIVGQLETSMPAAAAAAAHERLPAGAADGAARQSALPVQRNGGPAVAAPPARSTASGGEVWAGLMAAFAEKWAALDLWKMVKDVLVSIVNPWSKIAEEFGAIPTDMVTAAGTLFAPRSPFTDIAGCLHDIWSNAMKLLDFPMVLWRRINNIGLLLLGPVTIALTVIGFFGGALAGTVLGAIAGALAGLGIGAAPGGGAGFGIGGSAGAGLGFGVAMGLGQVVLVSFVAGEATSLVKVLLDLFTTHQTREEKAADFHTAADNALALGITAVLVAVGWLGGRVASAAAATLRRITPTSVLRVIDDFARGVRGAREGGVPDDGRPRDAPAVELAGRQSLLTDIAGSRTFAERIRAVIATVQRPGARPALEARLRAALDELARIETEAHAARTPAEVEALNGQRRRVQSELGRLNRDANAAVPYYPESWRDFDSAHHAEFEAELGRFRGTADLEPSPGLRGGEGQLFLGPNPTQALKRWFRSRLGDMGQSVRLLDDAGAAVSGHPRLSRVLEVVEVSQRGQDWVMRGFDPSSVPLSRSLTEPAAAAARTEAIAALEGASNPVLVNLRGKLTGNSANLHWSPTRGRILVIDMQ